MYIQSHVASAGAAARGMLRPTVLQQEEAGELWDGPVPEPHLGPLDVISLTLLALSRNDIAAQPHAGTALLRRFSTSTFALVGEPQPRQTPRELSAFFASSPWVVPSWHPTSAEVVTRYHLWQKLNEKIKFEMKNENEK